MKVLKDFSLLIVIDDIRPFERFCSMITSTTTRVTTKNRAMYNNNTVAWLAPQTNIFHNVLAVAI